MKTKWLFSSIAGFILVLLPIATVLIYIRVNVASNKPENASDAECVNNEMSDSFYLAFAQNNRSKLEHALQLYPALPAGSSPVLTAVTYALPPKSDVSANGTASPGSATVSTTSGYYSTSTEGGYSNNGSRRDSSASTSNEPLELDSTAARSYKTDTYLLDPKVATAVDLPGHLEMKGSEIAAKGVRVRAVNPGQKIGVYAMNGFRTSCDGFMVLPERALGTEHYLVTFFPQYLSTQVVVVATRDNTTVDLYLRPSNRPGIVINYLGWTNRTYRGGQTISVPLNQLESVEIQADQDLSGCRVTSNHPIAVFSGDVFTHVDSSYNGPYPANQFSHLVEQMPSVEYYGTVFFAIPFFRFSNGSGAGEPGAQYSLQVIAPYPNTTLTFHFGNSTNITKAFSSAVNVFRLFVDGNISTHVTSTSGILVAQYVGSKSGSNPAMVLLTPRSRYNSRYTVPTANLPTAKTVSPLLSLGTAPSFRHFLFISAHHSVSDSVTLNGVKVADQWETFEPSKERYVWTRVGVEAGVHDISADGKFGVYVFGRSGENEMCAYAYQAGICLD